MQVPSRVTTGEAQREELPRGAAVEVRGEGVARAVACAGTRQVAALHTQRRAAGWATTCGMRQPIFLEGENHT